MAMNYSRFQATLKGMTSAAQKVYAVIPAQQPWSATDIASELKRNNTGMEFRILQGCLRALVDSELIYENRVGAFLRAPVRGKPEKPLRQQEAEATTQEQPMTISAPTPLRSPVDTLGDLAAKARTLSAQLNSFALEIDAAALAAQDYVERSDADTTKLKQLQALLKGIAA